MNYIYDIFIKAIEENASTEEIKFKQAEVYSPYMELAIQNINTSKLPQSEYIEINALYRFQEIFGELFDINFKENTELKDVLFDILIHYLCELDLKQGLNKNEFYKKFLFKDVINNVYGEELAKDILCFNKEETDVFLNSFVTLYKTGTSLQLFNKILAKIFKYSIVYLNKESSKDIYIYLSEVEDKILKGKINAIINTFLPINMNVYLFWDKHFGILGSDNTMKIDDIVMIE
ncbi:hypothetical protein FDC50_03670 [Clostridium botulinum]|uniref:hypothetical protein n=1 Tax=unclassified Clostridium TaxID=2614128 RepID=UPI00050426F8|nr:MULTISPECIES: hypothetical protein [unclassified Clostridium]AIY78577.1 hypothetical protein U728_289 [Clostridium botulinum 202F]KAI3344151.1 hypothetical protein CIT17_18215 [Clostridium botulinum]KFX54933.1 hypothetical protein KU41_18725 [Clostridium botulinum]KFX57664.1 hypothetical protein KU40_06505 [Clostridium botulinum]KON12283.1 hypothetical protein ACP50_10140 [Clostridium botulinum]